MEIIDIHTHLLPGVDDSRLSSWRIKKMMESYKEARVNTLVFTPHINDPYVNTKRNKIDKVFEKASKAANDAGIRTFLGCEYYVQDNPKDMDYLPLAGKYVLCETDVNFCPSSYLDTLREIRAKGYQVILAHIERYKWLTLESELFSILKEEIGALMQVNVKGSKTAEGRTYLKKGVVDFLATDNHGDFDVPFGLYEVLGQYPDVAKKMSSFAQNL